MVNEDTWQERDLQNLGANYVNVSLACVSEYIRCLCSRAVLSRPALHEGAALQGSRLL
jgi:hypothetical protein